jgi:hypothetical protein
MIRAINVFPWDLAIEGVEPGIESIRRLECDTVALSVNYHRARLFRPRQPGLGFHYRALDWLDLDAGAECTEVLRSLVNPDPAQREVAGRTREECARRNLRFTATVIGCHNTTLGLARPEWSVCNAFGNRHTFSLCPANPEVRRYLCDLVGVVCRQLSPDAVLLDSFTFLDAVHREHHELMFVDPGAAARHLLSLCFCPFCMDSFSDAGRVQALARRVVEAALHDSRGERTPEFDREEQCALLHEFPELLEIEAKRKQTVSTLFQRMGEIASAHNVQTDSSSGLLARPCARSWTEGTALTNRARVCRHIYVQSHFPSAALAAQDLRWAATLVPAAQLVQATMVGEAHIPSGAELAVRAAHAVELGAAGVCYYNYGLLNKRRLEWIRDANREILRKEKS